jgi:predicted nucleotidyltransferase
MTKEALKSQLQQAIESIPHKEAIKSVSLFGSYINGQPTEDSDIDILIDILPESHIGFFELYDIQEALELRLGKSVDLLTPQAISQYMRPQVLKEAETVYER